MWARLNELQQPKVYNPILTFHFLEELKTFCAYPEEMLDQNLAPDYNKLIYISSHKAGKQLLLDAVNNDDIDHRGDGDEISREAALQPVSVATLNERFGMKEILQSEKPRDRLAALLCHLGALTVNSITDTGRIRLEIPNLVMRRLYAERILEMTFPSAAERDEGQAAADQLYARGAIAPVCEFIEQYYLAVYDNRDASGFNELMIKTLFLALLQHTQVYIMDSEPALQRRYADLIMLIRPDMRHFSIFDLLIEFKYVKLGDARQGKKKLSGQDLCAMTRDDLLALDVVQKKMGEAKTQLQAYRQMLDKKYGTTLKRRTYIVVGVGLDRLVWQEV